MTDFFDTIESFSFFFVNDPNEMDEEMIKRWNETVRPNDKVYHLGDVVINRKALTTLSRLNGDKVLIRGNHDIFKLEEYINSGLSHIEALNLNYEKE